MLRPATRADVHELMTWFADAASCELWAGPGFRYPFTAETFFEDLRMSSLSSYVMTDDHGDVVGFGQIYEKRQRSHLARLALVPAARGRRLGQTMIRLLIVAARELLPWRDCSLFVYRHNEAAYYCYRKMGFVETRYPSSDRRLPGCVFMVRRGPRHAAVSRPAGGAAT